LRGFPSSSLAELDRVAGIAGSFLSLRAAAVTFNLSGVMDPANDRWLGTSAAGVRRRRHDALRDRRFGLHIDTGVIVNVW
jgi:hypothetical protein